MKLLWIIFLFGAKGLCSQADKDFLIVSTFSQGSANNCASIAIIKAAMSKYGYKSIFSMTKNGQNYKLDLKDGTALEITEAELSVAEEYAKFIIHDIPSLGNDQKEIQLYAYLAYAAIAKFIVVKGYWGCIDIGSPHHTDITDYKKALSFISRTGICTDYCYKYLGLKVKENKVYDFSNVSQVNQKGVVLYSWGHAVTVYNGMVNCYDNWITASLKTICGQDFKWYLLLD